MSDFDPERADLVQEWAQRRRAVTRLLMCNPAESELNARGALTDLVAKGDVVALSHRFNLPRASLIACQDVEDRLAALHQILDAMGVPEGRE